MAFLLLGLTSAHAQGDRRWRPIGRADGLPSEDVLDLCSSGEFLWAATAAGLCRLDAHGVRRFGPKAVTLRVAAAPDGGVYALYADRILHLVGEESASLALPLDPAREFAQGYSFLSDTAGTLWLTTPTEVYRLPLAGAWERAPDRSALDAAGDPDGTSSPQGGDPRERVLAHGGALWKPTRGSGILRARATPRFVRYHIPTSDEIHALALDPDGSVWCGTNNGIARIKDGEITTFTHADGEELGVVTACAVDPEGGVWVGSGSYFKGVYRLFEGKWQRYRDKIEGYVHHISIDSTGVLWFAVLNPVEDSRKEGAVAAWYYAEGEFRKAPAIDELRSTRVYDIVARDRTGVLWFATLKGLAAYEGNGRVSHFTPENIGLKSEKVWCLCAARDGSLWIGYQSAVGASRLSRGELVHFTENDGLCDGSVWRICEGPTGVIWFATQHGLSRFDGLRWSCFRHEEELGVASIWGLLPDPDGSLWIGTLGAGVVHMRPDDTQPPRTRFELPRYHAEVGEPFRARWTGTDWWYDTPTEELWYRWRVDGGRWSKGSADAFLELSLDAGRHTLAVQAIDRFGNVEAAPAQVEIQVDATPPPLWLLAGAAGAILLGIGFLIGSRARRRGS